MATSIVDEKRTLEITPSEKHDVEHLETTKEDDLALQGISIFKSRYDDLSILRTLWVFKRVVLVVLAVYTGYMCEGFEVGHGLPFSS